MATSKNDEKSEWFTPEGYLITHINNKKFLIFPEALKYCGIKRGALRMQIERKLTENVDYIARDHYVFVSLEHCITVRNSIKINSTVSQLEKKHNIKFLPSDMEEFVKWKKLKEGKNDNDAL